MQGSAFPFTFYHPQRQIRAVVHGDDCVSVGEGCELQWMEQCLKKKYEIKTKRLGPKQHHDHEVKS